MNGHAAADVLIQVNTDSASARQTAPSVRMEDIDVSVEGNQIAIRAEVNRELLQAQGKELYSEGRAPFDAAFSDQLTARQNGPARFMPQLRAARRGTGLNRVAEDRLGHWDRNLAGGSVHDVSADVAQSHVPHVLIVEDDADVAALVATYLRGQGLHVDSVQSGHALFEKVSRDPVDVVLLDLGLPGEDGLAILRELRGRWRGPVIIVSGRGEAVERVVGLELGADDYVAKPFDFRELLARIRSVLRRTASESPDMQDESALLFNGMRLEPGKRRLVRDDGSEIYLSAGEFSLLSILAARPGHVFSRDALMSQLHGHDAGPYDRAIDMQVGRLRKKIEGDALHPQVIKSIRGAGYVFSAKVVRARA